MKVLAIVIGTTALVSVGCTTPVARVVTNVSGGPGEVTVEKCSIERNIWTGQYEERECNSNTYRVESR